MKLLPASKSSQEPIDVESRTVNTGRFFNEKEKTIKLLLKIEKKTIKIDKLLKRSLARQTRLNERSRIRREEDSFANREKELEKKKPKKIKGANLPNIPSFGIFDWIKNFIFNTILGFLAYRLIEYLPTLLKIVPIISKVADFIIDFGGSLLDKLVTAIDWGYKAYDATRGFVKNIFGKDGAKTFDDLSSKFTTFMNLAFIAGMLALSSGEDSYGGLGGKGGRKGFDRTGRRVKTKAQERYQRRFGKQRFKDRFGTRNAKRLEKLRRAATRAAEEGTERGVGSAAARGASKIGLKSIPIVGPIIDFAIRTLIFKEPLGRAAAGAVGVAVGQAIGAAIGTAVAGSAIFATGGLASFLAPIVIPAIAVAGGFIGDSLGTTLYDFINQIAGGTNQLAGGGTPEETTRKSNVSGPAKRTLRQKKTKRTLTPTPRKISPGASVGGKEKFQQLFPDTQKDNKDTTGKEKQNPYQYLTKSAENVGKAEYFGPLINLGMKANLGDTPNKTDYFLAAQGLNSWMNRILDFRGLAMAGGGEVNAQMLGMGEDYTRVIAKSLEESVSPSIDKTTKDLMRNLMLQKIEPKEDDKKPDEGDIPSGEDLGGSATESVGGAKLFMAQGFPMLAASILSGNIQQESGWKGQRDPWVLNDGAGTNKGLISWNRSRITNAEKFLGKPLEKASNAEQVKWIKEELRQYGLLKIFLNSNSTEDQLKSASYKYIGWGDLGDRWKFSKQIFSALQRGETGTYVPGISGKDNDEDRVSGKFKVIEYITGDRNHPNLDIKGHGLPKNYHDHIAFATIAEKENAKRALRAAGIIAGSPGGSEYRPGDPGYHGRNLAIDVPGAQWGGSGEIGPKEFAGSRKVRSVLGIGKIAPYEKGGETLDGIHLAMIGEKGKEYVLDTDSTKTIQKQLPGLLDILNYNVHDVASLKRNMPSIVETLQQYTSYEDGSDSEIIVIQDNADDTNDTYLTHSSSSNSMSFSSGIDNNNSGEFEVLHMV